MGRKGDFSHVGMPGRPNPDSLDARHHVRASAQAMTRRQAAERSPLSFIGYGKIVDTQTEVGDVGLTHR